MGNGNWGRDSQSRNPKSSMGYRSIEEQSYLTQNNMLGTNDQKSALHFEINFLLHFVVHVRRIVRNFIDVYPFRHLYLENEHTKIKETVIIDTGFIHLLREKSRLFKTLKQEIQSLGTKHQNPIATTSINQDTKFLT